MAQHRSRLVLSSSEMSFLGHVEQYLEKISQWWLSKDPQNLSGVFGGFW